MDASPPALDVSTIQRPDPALWRYYVLRSLVAGPAFPVLLAFLWLRFRSMRYRFDDEGISMRWGVLFRRQIDLTYARIQDIHLSSNAFERWLGLARIQIQTASGSAKAEMTVEGVRDFERLRDFLYSRMRGVADGRSGGAGGAGREEAVGSLGGAGEGELAELLREVAVELRALRRALGREAGAGPAEGRE